MSVPDPMTRLTKPQPYFNHTPLLKGEVRLIKIVDDLSTTNSNFDRPIHITITSLPLKIAPEYTAVSYTWDSPTYEVDPTLDVFCQEPRCYPIFTQGEILLGTRNLRDMLREIRQAHAIQPYKFKTAEHLVIDTEQYYWIDALSIDQDDLQERAAQVAIMGSIYKQSRACIVWLGREDEYVRSAFNLVVQFHSNRSLQDYLIGLKKDKLEFQRQFARLLGTLSKNQTVSIAKLFSRRYFSRLWIIPEIILARNIVVLCGSLIIPISALLSFTQMLNTAGDISFWPRAEQFAKECNINWKGLSPIYTTEVVLSNLYRCKQLDQHGQLPDFTTIMEMTAGSEAKEPHDRIYAIMSVVKQFMQQGKPTMEADYTLPVAKVFMNATIAIATNTKSLEILVRVGMPSGNYPDLPSWCPDFSTCGQATFDAYGKNHRTWHTGRLWTEPPNFTFRGSNLIVDGFRFDTISKVVQLQRRNLDRPDDELMPAFENWGSSHLELAAQLDWSTLTCAPYQSRIEALWRSLMQDNFKYSPPTEPAPQVAGLILPPLLSFMLYVWEGKLKREGTSDRVSILSSEIRAIQRAVTWSLRQEPESAAFLPEVHVLERLAKCCDDVHGWHLHELNDIERRADTAKLTKDLGMLVPFPVEDWLDNIYSSPIAAFFLQQTAKLSVPLFVDLRTFSTRRTQRLGNGVMHILEGDEVWYLHGAEAPCILRARPSGRYSFGGMVYIQGLMRGEIADESNSGRESVRRITIE